MNPAKTIFQIWTDMTYEGVMSHALVRLVSTVSHTLPRGLSHAARVAPSDMAQLSHVSSFSVTGPPRVPRPSFSCTLWPTTSTPFNPEWLAQNLYNCHSSSNPKGRII
jgi:hypothetical protein